MKHSVFFFFFHSPSNRFHIDGPITKKLQGGVEVGREGAGQSVYGGGFVCFIFILFIYFFVFLFIYLAATSGVTEVTHMRRFVLLAAHLPTAAATPPPRLRVAALVIREPK